MKLSANIDIKHLTRVEGHGNINIQIKDGQLQSATWKVVETPRFFEAMLVGKPWHSAPLITSRICGICSIGHTLASIRAVENAFGIEPTEQTRRLRLLAKHMETLQSHVLHLYFLVAPDFLGADSVLPLIESAPETVKMAAGLKLLANDGADLIAGRRLHPTTTVVGGFTSLPDKKALATVKQRILDAVPDLEKTVEIFTTFKIPDFVRETEFVSLAGEGEFPFIGGDLISTDGVRKNENEYLAMTNEYMVEQSTSKWTKLSRDSFAVGALARINNNYDLLHPKAREVAELLGLKPICHNPFMNNVAQLVEAVHVAFDCVRLIDEHLDAPEAETRQDVTPKAGTGVSAVEVPRGILYHCYTFDGEGKISASDCIIPTGQNHANIQLDLETLAAQFSSEMDDRQLELLASMLVRAYDPCISCSVH